MGHETKLAEAASLAGLFDQNQISALGELLPTLSPEQALWLSGYLAGLSKQAPGAGAGAGTGQAASAPAPTVTVLYGTETGTAASVAKQAADQLSTQGLNAKAVNMADYKTRDLKNESHVLLVSATHGEGDPPDPATPFFEFLWSRKAPKLSGVKFAVLSLGDSSYVHFCQAGKDLDRRFAELGGERIADRVDCDVDYEAPSEAWITSVGDALAAEIPSGGGQQQPGGAGAGLGLGALGLGAPTAQTQAAPRYSRKNPFPSEILDAVRLNGRESDKETQHVELSLEDSGLTFEPGDSLGIVPQNEATTVSEVLTALGLGEDAPVTVGETEKPIGAALRDDFELTQLTPGFLKAYAEASGHQDLHDLVAADNTDALQAFLKEHQVADVVTRYPASLDAATFTGMLRKLQPRLYSIASSQKALPDEVHLTVAATRWTPGGRARNGVASTYLADRVEPGQTVGVYVHRNETFKLPEDPTRPIIMIGPGTGVAPFRAFLQEREETAATGKSWLVFGERRFREDFLYQTDWQRWLADGTLTRMDVAFSRDQGQKVYVQDRLREKAADVYAWLREGAAVYVCGDAEAMAPAVHSALADVLVDQGGYSAADAEAQLKQMQRDRLYQRDVY
jgi:sulfite reductase (NADPH) flavoprotein alpha-component